MTGSLHPLLGVRRDEPGSSVFEHQLSPAAPAFIDQHRVFGVPVMPGSAMLEWALAALREAQPSRPAALGRIRLESPLQWAAGDHPVRVRASVSADGAVHCCSEAHGAWQQHLSGHAEAAGQPATPAMPRRPGLQPVPLDGFYEGICRLGIDYGPDFRGLRQLWREGTRVEGRIEVPAVAADAGAYLLHPVALDACFHLIGALFDGPDAAPEVPVGIDRLVVHHPLGRALWCVLDGREPTADGERIVDLDVFDPEGRLLVQMRGLRFRRAGSALRAAGSRAASAAPALRCYGVRWQPAPAAAALPPPPAAAPAWLLAGPDFAVLDAWAAEFARLGLPAARADAPEPPAAPGRRVAGLMLLDRAVQPAPGSDAGPWAAARDTALRGLDAVRRFLARTDREDDAPLVLVTHAAFGPDAAPDAAALAGSPWTGLTRAIAWEHPGLHCVQVDLPRGAGELPLQALLARVRALGGTGHLALRDGQWHEARLVPLDDAVMPPASPPAAPPPPVRADASYLVTGAFGGLGRLAAQWLAGRGARSLVLIGRRLPADLDWLDKLRIGGIQLTARAIDVADEPAMRQLFDDVARTLPPLRGIVHAAGITEDAMLDAITGPACARVMEPKVRGSWLLHRLSLGLDLDFLVFYSALASLVGSPGQGSYIMANSFLDALALHRHAAGLPALAINWGPWADVGMAARRGLDQRMQANGLFPLAPAEAMHAFERLLAQPHPQAAVVRVDWDALLAAGGRNTPFSLLDTVAPHAAATQAPAIDWPALTAAEARERLLDLLHAQIARARGPATGAAAGAGLPGPRSGFAEQALNSLGLDSLMVIQLRQRLLAQCQVQLSLQQVMGGATAGEIADTLLQQILLRQLTRSDGGPQADADDLETVLL